MLALKFTPTKEVNFSGGYQWITLSKPDDTTLSYGSIWGYAPYNGTADWANNSSKSVYPSGSTSKGGDKQDIDFWWVGGEYSFGERFHALEGLTLSAAYYRTEYGNMYGDNAVAGKAFNIDTETAILDYKLNKRFDIYGAATWNQFSGDYVNGVGAGAVTMLQKHIDAYGLGVRMKF